MNYEEALLLQKDSQFLIGQTGKYNKHPISDIFVVPTGNERSALERILVKKNLSPKQIATSYGAKKYSVIVLFEIDGNYTFEDISIYMGEISHHQ